LHILPKSVTIQYFSIPAQNTIDTMVGKYNIHRYG